MLQPLEVPSGATNFLIQVLTSSGPAPDGLVVPVVDENFETVTDPPKGTVGSASRRQILWALVLELVPWPLRA